MDLPPAMLIALLAATAAGALGSLLWVLSRKGRSENQARAYLLGFNYVLSDDPDAAIAELSRAAELSTRTLETYFALGALFRRKGDLDRAIRLHQNIVLRSALEPEPRRRAQLALARDYQRGGMAPQAREALETLLTDVPDHAEALTLLRELCEDAGEWERAAELQASLLRAGQTGQGILAHHLAALARTKLLPGPNRAPDEALRIAQRAVELTPDSADALLALGEAQAALGDRGAAAEALTRAVDLEPELAPRALEPLLVVLSPAEVERLLRERATHTPRSGPFALALALHLRDRGQANAAIGILRALVDRQPRLWEARKELGALLLRQDRSEELRADYEEILRTLGQPPMGFLCLECRQKLFEHAFRCPACHAWDTVVREELAPVHPEASVRPDAPPRI